MNPTNDAPATEQTKAPVTVTEITLTIDGREVVVPVWSKISGHVHQQFSRLVLKMNRESRGSLRENAAVFAISAEEDEEKKKAALRDNYADVLVATDNIEESSSRRGYEYTYRMAQAALDMRALAGSDRELLMEPVTVTPEGVVQAGVWLEQDYEMLEQLVDYFRRRLSL